MKTRHTVTSTRHCSSISATISILTGHQQDTARRTEKLRMNWLLHENCIVSVRGREPDPETLATALALQDVLSRYNPCPLADLDPTPVHNLVATRMLDRLNALPPHVDPNAVYETATANHLYQ